MFVLQPDSFIISLCFTQRFEYMMCDNGFFVWPLSGLGHPGDTSPLSQKGSWENLQPPSQYWCILPVDTRVPLVVADCLTFISYFKDIPFFFREGTAQMKTM